MSTASPAATPAKKTPPKRAPKAPSLDAAPQEQQQAAQAPATPEPEYKAPANRKETGKAVFDLKDVPAEIKTAASARFGKPGVEVNISAARANGSYRGEVLASDSYLAQKVGENSIVIHKKDDLEFVSQKHQWANENKKLGGADLAIHYDEDKAKAYPHDKQREELNKMINTMKKTAEKLGVPGREEFNKNLDAVKEGMLQQMKEKKVEQVKSQEKPKERAQQEHSR